MLCRSHSSSYQPYLVFQYHGSQHHVLSWSSPHRQMGGVAVLSQEPVPRSQAPWAKQAKTPRGRIHSETWAFSPCPLPSLLSLTSLISSPFFGFRLPLPSPACELLERGLCLIHWWALKTHTGAPEQNSCITIELPFVGKEEPQTHWRVPGLIGAHPKHRAPWDEDGGTARTTTPSTHPPRTGTVSHSALCPASLLLPSWGRDPSVGPSPALAARRPRQG